MRFHPPDFPDPVLRFLLIMSIALPAVLLSAGFARDTPFWLRLIVAVPMGVGIAMIARWMVDAAWAVVCGLDDSDDEL